MATVINSLRDRADTLATALKSLYVKLGGELTDKPDGTHTVAELVTIPECVDAITSIAEPGGGGSSDFSTAEVTFVNTSESGIAVVNVASSFWDDEYSEGGTNGVTWVYPNQTLTMNVVLYKGCAYAEVSSETTISSITGDIEREDNNLVITGAGAATLVGGLIE